MKNGFVWGVYCLGLSIFLVLQVFGFYAEVLTPYWGWGLLGSFSLLCGLLYRKSENKDLDEMEIAHLNWLSWTLAYSLCWLAIALMGSFVSWDMLWLTQHQAVFIFRNIDFMISIWFAYKLLRGSYTLYYGRLPYLRRTKIYKK